MASDESRQGASQGSDQVDTPTGPRSEEPKPRRPLPLTLHKRGI